MKQTSEEVRTVNSFSVKKNHFLGRATRLLGATEKLLMASPKQRNLGYVTYRRLDEALKRLTALLEDLDEVPYTGGAKWRARQHLQYMQRQLEGAFAMLQDRLDPEQALLPAHDYEAMQDLDDIIGVTSSEASSGAPTSSNNKAELRPEQSSALNNDKEKRASRVLISKQK